jgi:hypothetical protein
VKSTDLVSASGRNHTSDWRKVSTNSEMAERPPPEEKLMVNPQRPDDSIESAEPDVEGHRVLRADAEEGDDTEGHRVLRADAEEGDDTEGHRVLRVADDEDDDTEGHRVLR